MLLKQKGKSAVSKREEEILSFWNKNQIFKKSLEKKSPMGDFVFYDGPPFATGTPHYGHLVASVIKDVIPRYKTMQGFRVERQWGWDCHGLPIENIVEKELGIKTKKEIETLGIKKFNELCKEKIFSYLDVWNKFIPRFGRFADMEHPYRTMDASYMESEWWAFKTLFDKGLLYKEYRSLHICPRCETTLAQAEVADEYRMVKDIAVTAKFELVDEPGTFLLAWTTTPWTLPGNVALAVNKKLVYGKIQKSKGKNQNDNSKLNGGETYIVVKERIADIFAGEPYELIGELRGEDFVGKKYKPLFDDYAHDEALPNRENGWRVYAVDFVTTESGTGIVHIAPAFGQDDLELSQKERLPFVQHVDMDGVIKETVKDLAGLSVKPAGDHQATDVEIIKLLAKKGLLFSKEKYEHSYPHCWRCETLLLNYATNSWFVAVQKIKNELIKNAEGIEWFPSHIKKGRWGEWLLNAKDWSISRQRFWANTIPVWVDERGETKFVAGSIEELKKHTRRSGNSYFLMRHGEAEHNILDVSNSKDTERYGLTEKGRKMVEDAAKKLKKENIDLVFYSPFRRTRETAEILADALDVSRKNLVEDLRLREIDVGVFDGKPTREYHTFFSSPYEKFFKTPPDGENLLNLKKRVTEFLYEIEKMYSGKNVLIVSHEYPIWLLSAGSLGLTAEETMLHRGEKKDFIDLGEVRALSFVPLPHNENYELDLHRPYIDEIEVVGTGGEHLRRTADVLDTWFNSGSVPFSSYHYPFENKKKVEKRIPADFIGEGQDQVSKWFYYQHVLSGALFKKRAFTNVIVNGIVLAEDGKKMSKRLQNYPDPALVVERYGADAVRLYLLASSVVAADNLNFSEAGVAEISRKVLGRLENVYSFYALYKDGVSHVPKGDSSHVLDRFIIALLHETWKQVTDALERYELHTATRHVMSFVEDLSTWYIRRSRERFKSENEADKKAALETAAFVLREYARLLAPFAPFIAEWLWQNIKDENDAESIHLEEWKTFSIRSTDVTEVLPRMAAVRSIVSEGLERRLALKIKVRQPLSRLFLKKEPGLSDEYRALIKDELNVEAIEIKPEISYALDFDSLVTPELKEKGRVRECIRFIQDARKNQGLKPGESAALLVKTNDDGKKFIERNEEAIKKAAGIHSILFESAEGSDGERVDIDDFSFAFGLKKQ